MRLEPVWVQHRDFPRSPGGLNHPEEVVLTRIGKETQPLTGRHREGLWGLRCTISSGGPAPSGEAGTHPHLTITN